MKNRIKKIIRKAGIKLREEFYHEKSIETKSSYRDVVTKIDTEIELFLKNEFKKIIPGSLFLAEETDSYLKNAEYLWIIDPIDGTVNFVHQFPFTAISVALYKNNQAIMGFVYNPILEEFFEAEKGEGSFLNGKPISVSQEDDISKVICATGFPYAFGENEQDIYNFLKHMKAKIRGIRRAGSAALDLCYLAKGVFSGFWEWHLKPWDIAAGKLIIEEAGGKTSTIEGNNYKFGDITFVATNNKIDIVKEYKQGKKLWNQEK